MMRAAVRTIVGVLLVWVVAACGGKQQMAQFVPAYGSNASPDTVVAPSNAKGIVVTSTRDNGAGSLRDAVSVAQREATITFRLPKRAQIKLSNGPIIIAKDVTISGPGAASLIISGQSKSEIFKVAPHTTAAIGGVTLTKGSAAQGGAIYNAGSLT